MLKFATVLPVIPLIILTAAYLCAGEEYKNSEVFSLGEVIVYAGKEGVNLATTVTEINEEDIKARGAQTVAEALDYIPGVDVHIGGRGQFHVNIRGFAQKDVKILIDGVPANESYFGTLDLSLIPVDAVSKISVVKGASSVLYGANTMGGVINIITKKGGVEPVTEFITSFGDYGTRNYILNHGAATGNFNYWLTYGYRESDGFRLSGDFDKNSNNVGEDSQYHEDGGKRDLSNYIKRTLNAKIGYEPDPGTEIYLSFDYHNNERGCPSEYNRFWAFSKWDQWHINLVGKKKFNDFLSIKAHGFYVDHDDTLVDVSWNDEHTTRRKWFEKSAYDDFTTGGELHAYFDFGKFSLVKTGFSYLRDNHKQKDFLDEDCRSVQRGSGQPGWQEEEEYEADTYSFAIEDEIKASDMLSFIFGISYDYFEPKKAFNQPVPDSINSANPQGGVVFFLNNDTSLHASVGKKTRFPQLKELYSRHTGGNPDLDPQKTVCYEIGADHDFSEAVTCSVAYFYNDIKDLINKVNNDGEPYYENIGEARMEGVEASLNMDISDQLQAGINYTYLATWDKEYSREIEGRPRHRLNLDLRYRFFFGLSANLQASYTQRQFEYNKSDEKRKGPDFFIVGARVSQNMGNFWDIDSELFARVSNLTDRNYNEGHPMPGRNFLIGLTLRY